MSDIGNVLGGTPNAVNQQIERLQQQTESMPDYSSEQPPLSEAAKQLLITFAKEFNENKTPSEMVSRLTADSVSELNAKAGQLIDLVEKGEHDLYQAAILLEATHQGLLEDQVIDTINSNIQLLNNQLPAEGF